MRIGVVAPPWAAVPPTGYGGTEAVVDLLARCYRDAGHEVVLFTTGDSTCPVERRWVYPEAQGDRMGSAEAAVRHALEAYDALVGDVDIVHDHTIPGPHLAARWPTTEVVATVHLPLEGDWKPIYGRVPPNVHLVAISEAQRRVAPDVRIASVIHHGLDPATVTPGDGLGGYVLFLGRICPDKGVLVAIEAARKAGVPLRIAAKVRSDDEADYFRDVVEPELGPEIVFLGEVAGDEKAALLRDARALLFPTQWNEPFGMVMIEAMASGTPVLATPCGAVPEVVDDGVTGFLCSDGADMAAAIGRLDEIDRGACRRAVEERFSATRMAADYLDLFERIVASRHSASNSPC